MKAYRLSIKDNDEAGNEIVFAENAKAAKKLIGDLSDSLEEYTDLLLSKMGKPLPSGSKSKYSAVTWLP